MRQPRLMSLVEAIAKVLAGFLGAVVTQAVVFPILGLEASVMQNLKRRWSSPASRSPGATCYDGFLRPGGRCPE